MPTLFRLSAAAFLLAAVGSSSAGAAEKLTMKFQVGETYGYLIDQQMKVEGQAQGRTIESEMGQKLSISTHIKSVDDEGNARAEQTIERVRMKMQLPAPVSKTIEYDTDDEESADDPIMQQLAKTVGTMVGEAIAMTISPTGEMTDVVIPEKLKKAQQAPGSPVSGNQLEQTFKQSGLRLPQKEVAKGDSWDQDIEMELPFGTMKIRTTYTYQGKNEDGLDKIDAKMDVNLEAKADSQMQVKATSKEASGTYLFDNEAGKLTRSEIKQILDIEIVGLATQNITTLVTMTLTDGEDAAGNSSNN